MYFIYHTPHHTNSIHPDWLAGWLTSWCHWNNIEKPFYRICSKNFFIVYSLTTHHLNEYIHNSLPHTQGVQCILILIKYIRRPTFIVPPSFFVSVCRTISNEYTTNQRISFICHKLAAMSHDPWVHTKFKLRNDNFSTILLSHFDCWMFLLNSTRNKREKINSFSFLVLFLQFYFDMAETQMKNFSLFILGSRYNHFDSIIISINVCMAYLHLFRLTIFQHKKGTTSIQNRSHPFRSICECEHNKIFFSSK